MRDFNCVLCQAVRRLRPTLMQLIAEGATFTVQAAPAITAPGAA